MSTSTQNDSVAKLLEDACDRNLPVEIHHHTVNDELIVARSRILDLDEEFVFLDSMQSIGKRVSFRKDKLLTVYFFVNGVRHAFQTRVVQSEQIIELNERKRVLGVSVTRPSRIDERQRREDFRVSLACTGPVPIDFHEQPSLESNQCPINAKRFKGVMVDVSRGGLAAIVDLSEHDLFKPGDLFFVTAILPYGIGETVLPVEVRQVRLVRDDSASRVGFRFPAWEPRVTQPHRQRVAKFVVSLERLGRQKENCD
jgi:c-di-GMP-binding flagellar brake protein YcgR